MAVKARDWAGSDYSRIYHSVVNDTKLGPIFQDDRAWAAYTRLLITADATYPAPAPLPRQLGRYAEEKLKAAGVLIPVGNDHYTLSGLSAEREARAHEQHNGGKIRAETAERGPNGRFLPSGGASGGASAGPSGGTSAGDQRHQLRRDETSKDETRRDEHTARGLAAAPPEVVRDGLPHLDRATVSVLEEITGRHAGNAGDRQLTELDRLVEDHTGPVVQAAMRFVANGRRMTARQLIWPVVKYLEPMAEVPQDVEPDPADVKRQLHERRQQQGAASA